MSTLGPALSNILIQIPVYLVWIAGLIVAVVTWRKHARASLLTSLVMMVAWALIIAAVFLPRTPKPDTSS
jgi:hypothetical protein